MKKRFEVTMDLETILKAVLDQNLLNDEQPSLVME